MEPSGSRYGVSVREEIILEPCSAVEGALFNIADRT